MYSLDEFADIYVCTDASDYGIGGYCYQIIDDKERPVAFMSKSLTSTQLLWPIIQKEAYSILSVVRTLIIWLETVNLLFILTTVTYNLSKKIQTLWLFVGICL